MARTLYSSAYPHR
ncbi:hypothetical protein YPPY36_1409, partial [Yersinia pestis PY-36]